MQDAISLAVIFSAKGDLEPRARAAGPFYPQYSNKMIGLAQNTNSNTLSKQKIYNKQNPSFPLLHT
ncbi:hypothetical protein JFL43_20540 [Viridibacillus sp. YIM B01967]|uniref:Uncharacterized protein n=2 Tax=Viridibacillus soli TaxID=2798301 RepID=A0ABS1HDL5_9BACL|nr:hypothetical protein [Viridibacillus soli]